MKRKGAAPIKLDDLSDDDRDQLLESIAKKDPGRAMRLLNKAKREDRRVRAKDNAPREPERKPNQPRGGVSLKPATDPMDALNQMKRSFANCWIDDPNNPAVALVASEHHLCARINTFSEGRWVHRRVGDDAVVAVVRLQDGTQETRKFKRGVIDAEWKRS